MKEFRRIEEVDAARLPPDLARAVRGTLEALIGAYAEGGAAYDPEADGWTVLVEPGDSEEMIGTAIGGHSPLDAPFEGVTFEYGCFVAVWLANNQFGITVVVPDAPWLPPELRARLMREAGREVTA